MHWTIIVLVYMIKRGILRYPASHLSIVKFLLLSRRSFFENLKIIRYEKRNMKCAKYMRRTLSCFLCYQIHSI